MNFQEKWRKLLLPLRYGGSGVDFKKLDPARSPFLQDRDRIIYSSSFRRLARKTQVHPLVRNDHIHTRLSHSLEVSSVGRSLGAMAGYFLRRRDELPEYAAPEYGADFYGGAVPAPEGYPAPPYTGAPQPPAAAPKPKRKPLQGADLRYVLWSGSIVSGVLLTLVAFVYACTL